MGVNLQPEVTFFNIRTNAFFKKSNSHIPIPPNTIVMKIGNVEECGVSEGIHTILNFNFIIKNTGDKDLIIGNPASRPDLYEPSLYHPNSWVTKEKINEYHLKDTLGRIVSSGNKRSYCIKDTTRFSCDNQGISSGSQDTYSPNEFCNFLVIDDLPNGIYYFQAATNISKVFEEDNYSDNFFSTKLSINIQERFVSQI